MARKPRIEFEGALYHVIVRGNQRQKIFRDSYDFINYLEILSDYKKKYPYFLYAYVLMSNHVHVLIETRTIPLSKILQGINQRYTLYFNRKYKTVGHLFQGRYKAILCEKDEYLLSLIKYIHLNPMRANIVKTPDKYQWSSHYNYVRKTVKKNIIDTDQVLRMFSENKARARKLYRFYVGDGIIVKKDDIYNTIDQRIIGGEKFVNNVMEKYDGDLRKEKKNKEYPLSEIARGVEKEYGVTLKQIQGKSKARYILQGKKLISLAAKEYGYKGREIAAYIKKDPAMVTRYLKEKGNLKKEVEKIMKGLTKKAVNVNSQV